MQVGESILKKLGLSLRTKLMISALLVLLPIVLLLIWNYVEAYNQQKSQLLSDEIRVAQGIGISVDGAFDKALAIDQSYADDPVILSFDGGKIDNYLANLSTLYPEYETALMVFDAQGNLVGSSSGPMSLNVADLEWFQDVISTGQPVVSDVHISTISNEPIVHTAVPIIDSNGRRVGAVSTALSVEHFPETLETVNRSPGLEIFLADRTGRLAFHTGVSDMTWEQRDASGFPPVQAALQGQIFASEQITGFLGGERMIAAAPTPKYGWVVGVSLPVNEALAPLRSSMVTTIITFVGVAIFTFGLVILVSEFLTRPLKELTETAVALGQGDLRRRVDIETGDELERLGDSFNAMADQVQRALRLREEFIATASHELRTPLTIIKGYLQLLLTRENDPAKRRIVQTMVKQTDRISELLNEMLAVSEFQAGRVGMHRERIDLAALASEVVERIQVMAEKHQLRFKADGPVIVSADRNQIDIVLTNLIDNAVRYSPQGGPVDVSITETGTEAIVSIKDYGMGIPKDKQKNVFEPFFQLQPATAGFGGMGLGLYISKQIIEQHGGRIWFESEAGKGSTFYFTLPLA